MAVVNHQLAKRAEANHPPSGKFIDVDGVRLHYVERGQGHPLVLLHGNGSMIEDFGSSGLLDQAARNFRIIVFDRPGYGHSRRPRTTIWGPGNQAELIHKALTQMGILRSLVFGHSWGTSVAIALALKHPEAVAALILASGYYYPTARSDVALLSAPAIPILGDILRHTLAPLLSRAMWPAMTRKLFDPAPVPKKFEGFPKEMAFRPSQLRASAAEAAMMIPDAFAAHTHYPELKMPTVIIAGQDDRLVDVEQSARLHRDIPQSTFHRIAGAGHMIHQSATADVMAAITEAAGLAICNHREAFITA